VLVTSLHRPRDDKAWNYLRPPSHVQPYLLMHPIEPGSDICECIVLDGHRGKEISNSDSPPNSFHTSDLFIAHPTIPNAWKFLGRSDDRVTLLNGEKVLPLPIEGRIVQHPLVNETVVFGVDRPVPGPLLFKSQRAAGMSDGDVLEHVWPRIVEAIARAEAFSQIGRDMVVVLGDGVLIPSTDKSTFKRAQVGRIINRFGGMAMP
jgi:acyl-CoA synthetase (AMP-forming)/AMP-acid ligase II